MYLSGKEPVGSVGEEDKQTFCLSYWTGLVQFVTAGLAGSLQVVAHLYASQCFTEFLPKLVKRVKWKQFHTWNLEFSAFVLCSSFNVKMSISDKTDATAAKVNPFSSIGVAVASCLSSLSSSGAFKSG